MKKENKSIIAYIFGPAIFTDDSSAAVDVSSRIVDPKAIDSIKKGVQGLSPEMNIEKFFCSICNSDHEFCEHQEGKYYQDNLCRLIPKNIEFTSLSLVMNPEDPRAKITDMLTIEKQGNTKKYTWYGYSSDNENRRFKHIQKAKDQNLISEKIALHFSTFFNNTIDGIVEGIQ